jgi:MerR family transcriptional regulator, light-induced transcriptional regulator
MATGYLRIGEFSQRVGVSAERLRAWEQRYDLLAPERSPGGFRLYSDEDAARVQRMLSYLDGGVSAAEAATLARAGPSNAPPVPVDDAPAQLDGWVARLRERLEQFDDAGAHGVLDALFASFSVEAVVREVVLPCLADIGAGWAEGTVTIGQEHFASNLLRARLLSLAQGWGQGLGPRAVLAAPPGEQHDLALVACGLALYRQGMPVVFLGADCPVATLRETVATVRPALVLLAAADAAPFRAVRDALRTLAADVPLCIAGAGASEPLAEDLGATYVGEDPTRAAQRLAGELSRQAAR